MAYKAKFGEVELDNYFKILKVTREVIPSRNNMSKVISTVNGSKYTGFRYGERLITLEILMKPNNKSFSERIIEIASILDTKEPVPLEIDDLPGKYVYAVVNSIPNIDRIRRYGKGTIEFICYDPFIYSKDFKCYRCSKQISTIINSGTRETYPIISVDFKNPACMVQITDSLGRTILIGKTKDATIPTQAISDIVIDDYCNTTTTFSPAGDVLDASNKLTDGTFALTLDGGSIYCNNYGTQQEKKWNGASFRRNIGQNLEQFEVAANFTFSSKGRNMQIPNEGDKALCISKSGALIKSHPNNEYNQSWTMPYYGICTVLEQFNNGHAKVKYENITGWVETKYINRIIPNSNTRAADSFTDVELAENQMGCIECYGFDSQGRILFKLQMLDVNEFFEHNKPSVWIGNGIYLADNQETPTPSQIRPKDDNGNYLPNQNIESGAYGRWNDYQGTFRIRRRKLESGKYRWWASINRTADGINVSQEINMGPGIVNDSLPTGELNHLVFYIARYSSYPEVTEAHLNHVKVKDISKENIIELSPEDYNKELFNPGDRLEINCETGEVRLNGENSLEYLDIGSLFFPLEPGINKIAVITDDKEADVLMGFKERWI